MELSEHDKKIDAQIQRLDDESFYNWTKMIDLASQLESKERYEFWNKVCRHYYHLEEASIGEL